ncbi:hypothetical protein [Nicoliella lavandulae]|uniref:Knr4/Smi1-like domain-containing protein n=1 Tax=Nicoliella lavandulae TaxID=3082954 RepID=A0ABU8SPQ6_9LACO
MIHILIDNRIFNELEYYYPSGTHYPIIPGDERIDEVIETLIRKLNPKETDEDDGFYQARIDDELASDPLLGIIDPDSLLYAGLMDWQKHTGKKLPIFHIREPLDVVCFLTHDTNADVVDMDLLDSNGSGAVKKDFLTFLNQISD